MDEVLFVIEFPSLQHFFIYMNILKDGLSVVSMIQFHF